MKISNYNYGNPALLIILLFVMMSNPFIMPPLALCEDHPLETDDDLKGIQIFTDQAIVDSLAKYTEFTGNVKVMINDVEIRADWLKINYRAGIEEEMKLSASEKSIKNIIAKGNVKILFDDKVAITQEAVYIPDKNTLLLTGENSKVSSGNNYITGDKITLNRNDGTFKVERVGEKQVEAIFFSD